MQAESSSGPGSTPAPSLPGRRSWQQPGSLSGGPSGQKEEVHWQPSQGTEPAPRARAQVAPSVLGKGWSRAPGAALEAARSPRPEPLTCLSVLGSQGWALARLWLWLWHCPTWPELLQAQCAEFLGSPVLQQLLCLQQLCFTHAQGVLHVFSLPTAGLDRLLLILSVH